MKSSASEAVPKSFHSRNSRAVVATCGLWWCPPAMSEVRNAPISSNNSVTNCPVHHRLIKPITSNQRSRSIRKWPSWDEHLATNSYLINLQWRMWLWTVRSLVLKKNWNAQAGDSTSEARLHKGRETLKKGTYIFHLSKRALLLLSFV